MALLLLATTVVFRPATTPSVLPQTQFCVMMSTADQVQGADVVLSGTVAMVVPDTADTARVIVQPDQVYRGRVSGGSLTLHAAADRGAVERSAGEGQLHFTSAQPPWLFFLYQQVDGTFTTSRCAGTRPLGTGLTVEEQQLLKAGVAA